MKELARWRRPRWLSYLDRTNFIVTALTGSVILGTRSAGVTYFAAGAVMCTFSVKLLKVAIRQPRPINQTSRQKTSYGMPSTHSATISYYATYIPLASLFLPLHESFPMGVWFRILPPLVFLPCAAVVVLSRIWLGHHTLPQVAAGVSFGLAFALIWFKLWCTGLDSYGPMVEELVNGWIGT
ncbi:putative PAP2 superfamily protein [Lyophyllum shimeji]|uniref:PAP2 superfamily protein n=1 Tax=Lyophyllum shimeji TaxID=47721 RepID=A0A9P3PGB2_LYOSH|nr:putative PAP2 superfamily protein [Lyophyllum shimeji]